MVLVENRGLRAEVKRLHMENIDLLRRVRYSDSNAHYMRNQVHYYSLFISAVSNAFDVPQVVSNIADRAELLRQLEKTETQVYMHSYASYQ